jgi:DNA polymerase elongation subunit (family B)
MTNKITIALIGEVSSGKSSFLNSLIGYPQSSTSLQRETFQPISYRCNGKFNVKELLKNSLILDEIHDDNRNKREEYEGAFVFEPDPNLYEWVASFDFASLNPSIMRQFKLSIENFKFKDKNHQPTKDEIKTFSGAVFDASYEPLIPEILTDYYSQRKEAKKISMIAEKEMDALKHILEERKKQHIANGYIE